MEQLKTTSYALIKTEIESTSFRLGTGIRDLRHDNDDVFTFLLDFKSLLTDFYSKNGNIDLVDAYKVLHRTLTSIPAFKSPDNFKVSMGILSYLKKLTAEREIYVNPTDAIILQDIVNVIYKETNVKFSKYSYSLNKTIKVPHTEKLNIIVPKDAATAMNVESELLKMVQVLGVTNAILAIELLCDVEFTIGKRK